ncbi:MAG: hypothetical protein EP343_25480 [Deltaproteobacteria bacterium]|nr:MAG: hypothetical protein EP343_25480 [Deltaproteobacteria bacterium]
MSKISGPSGRFIPTSKGTTLRSNPLQPQTSIQPLASNPSTPFVANTSPSTGAHMWNQLESQGPNIQPHQMLQQWMGLQNDPSLAPLVQMLQPALQSLQASLQGPLATWPPAVGNNDPVSMLQTMAPLAQAVGQLLSQLGRLPQGAMHWPFPPQMGGFSLPKQQAHVRAQLARYLPQQPTAAGMSGVSGMQGAQSIQALQGTSDPSVPKRRVVDFSAVQDAGNRIADAVGSDDNAKKRSHEPLTMALATPDQKGRMIKRLIKGHTTDSEDRAIVKILESCTSKKELDAVMDAAGGANKIRKELDDKGARRAYRNVRDKFEKSPDLVIQPNTGKGASFAEQVAAYRQDAAKWRPDTDVPAAKNMTAQEACSYFERIKKARSSDDAASAIAKDPKAMALATNDDKAAMVRRLIRGHTTNREDRAMVDILESCNTKADFEEVMKASGGKDVVDEMDHGPSRDKMNMLTGAWGCMGWANDKGKAKIAENALADPSIGAEFAGLPPQGVQATEATPPSQWPSDPAERAVAEQRWVNRQRSQNVHREPRAYKELIFENASRKAQGREPLDYKQVAGEVHDAMTEAKPTHRKVTVQTKGLRTFDIKDLDVPVEVIDGKQLESWLAERGFPPKKFGFKIEPNGEARKRLIGGKMEEIRKKYGVGKEEMRDMFTYREGEIHRTGARDLSRRSGKTLQPLQARYQQAVKQFGPNSVQAQQAKADLDKAQSLLGKETQRMGETAEAAESLYPTPLSGLDKFVGFFEKFGEMILDIFATLLNAIPGVGNIISAVYHGIKFLVKSIQGDVMGALTSVASAVTGVGGALSGAVSAGLKAAGVGLKAAGSAIQGGVGLAQAIESENPLAALGALGSTAGGVGNALGGLSSEAAKLASQSLQGIKTGINAAGSGYTMIKGMADGNLAQALAGLGGVASSSSQFAGGTAKDVLSGLGTGVRGINDLAHGRVGAGLSQLQNSLSPALQEMNKAIPPEARQTLNEIQSYLKPGAQLVEGLATGRTASITNSLLDIGGLAGQQIPGMKEFLQQKDVQQAFDTLKPLGQFANGLLDNNVPAALQGATGALQSLVDHPDAQKGIRWANDIGQVLASTAQGSVNNTLDALGKSGLVRDFLNGVQSGELGAGVQRFAHDIHSILQNPQVQQASDWLRAGTLAVKDLAQGHTGSALAQLTSPHGPLQNHPGLKELTQWTQATQPFLQGLTTGRLDQLLGQLPSITPNIVQSPAYREALQHVAPFTNLLRSLEQGQLSRQFQTLLGQLQPLSNPNRWMAPIQDLQQRLDQGIHLEGTPDAYLLRALGM